MKLSSPPPILSCAALGAILGLFSACGAPPMVPAPPDTGPELEALELFRGLYQPVRPAGQTETRLSLVERLAHHRVPAISIAVIDGGELRWAKSWSQIEATDSVGPETVFEAGSISKLLAATAALRLVKSAALDLDEDLGDRFSDPRFADLARGVSLRHLLSHTAGLGTPGFAGYPNGVTLPSVDQIVLGEAPADHPALSRLQPPSATWRYSGGGYQLVEKLLQDVTGQDYGDLVAAEIFDPLEMSRSSFTDPRRGETAARGHLADGEPVADGWRRHPERAAAGLWSTPSDLAAWIMDIQKAHAGKPARRLDQDTARAMLEPQEPGGWGLGPQLGGTGHASWFGHLGGNTGYRSLVLGFVSSGHGAVLMTSGDGGVPLIREVVAGLARLYDWPLFKPESRQIVELTGDQLESVAGRYRLSSLPEQSIELSIQDGVLEIAAFGQQGTLIASGENQFFELDQGFEITVTGRDDEGRASSVDLHVFPAYAFSGERHEDAS